MEEKRKKREEQRATRDAKTVDFVHQDQEICIMDQLLQEIREGTTLHPIRRRSSHRRNTQVSLEDMKRLQEMVKKGEEAFARRAS